MTVFLIFLGSLLILASIVMTFRSSRWSAAASFGGLLAFGLSGIAPMGLDVLIFWGVATLIVLGLNALLPRTVVSSRAGMGYVAGGTLVGLVVGLLMSEAAMILGAILGAIAGGIAFSRTPAGSVVEFPSDKFINYLCAKGLPAVVTFCQGGVVAVQAITYASI